MVRASPWLPEPAPVHGMAAFSRVLVAPPVARRAAVPKVAAPRPTEGLRILIVTDAWRPQVNGVVRTLESLARELALLGHEVRFATPERLMTVPLPTYPEIRLALFPRQTILDALKEFQPDAVHIATEGPMGFSARSICIERGLSFTTSFHTRFPDYVRARFPFMPEAAIYAVLKSFHAPVSAMMAATHSLKRELESRGFRNVRLWSRGVDAELFKPTPRDGFEDLGLSLKRPVFLYVGRVAVEKNVEAFLELDLPGTKVVVGDGPQRAALQARYGEAHFLGQRRGDELSRLYASSDVFVFPSRTDTYGLVILEALACGTPVAAYPVPGPLDVVGNATVAALSEDLRTACLSALSIRAEACREFALTRTWRACAKQFLENLAY